MIRIESGNRKIILIRAHKKNYKETKKNKTNIKKKWKKTFVNDNNNHAAQKFFSVKNRIST